jgi:putative Mg2+ transporter-C (MgtC) family protein
MATWWELGLRLLMAVGLGGVIGWEREVRGKPAGLRTQMLVALSAALYVMIAEQTSLQRGEPVEAGRALAGIAQGIGFLGAGAILQARGEVRWLTTAASLWAAAALGYATGLGMYALAGMAGALVFIILHLFSAVERRWLHHPHDRGDEEEHNGHSADRDGPHRSE